MPPSTTRTRRPVAKTETTADPATNLAAIRQRIADGDPSVTATELATAEAAVRLNELRSEAEAEAAVLATEEQRQAAIAEVLDDLRTGELQALATTAVREYENAVAALKAMHRANEQLERRRQHAVAKLKSLGPLPDGVEITRKHGEADSLVTPDAAWKAPRTDHEFVLEAAARALVELRPGAPLAPVCKLAGVVVLERTVRVARDGGGHQLRSELTPLWWSEHLKSLAGELEVVEPDLAERARRANESA